MGIIIRVCSGYSINRRALSGSGTSSDPYVINDKADFVVFCTNNITANGVDYGGRGCLYRIAW